MVLLGFNNLFKLNNELMGSNDGCDGMIGLILETIIFLFELNVSELIDFNNNYSQFIVNKCVTEM